MRDPSVCRRIALLLVQKVFPLFLQPGRFLIDPLETLRVFHKPIRLFSGPLKHGLELLLQLCQPAVDVRHTHRPARQRQQFYPHSVGDLPGQLLLFAHHRVEDGENRPLEGLLIDGWRVFAVFRPIVHPAGAAPHRPFLSPLVPHAAAVEGAAAAADQPLGEGVFAAVTGTASGGVPLVWGAAGVSPGKLSLYRVEFVPADDSLMVILDEVHGELSGVFDGPFADAVAHIGFL